MYANIAIDIINDIISASSISCITKYGNAKSNAVMI